MAMATRRTMRAPLTDFLLGRRAPQLPALEFAVLALGDSSYPKYCEVGRRIDERLAELGARRLLDRVDCDVDYEAPAAWLAGTRRGMDAEAFRRSPRAPARVAVLRPVASVPRLESRAPFAGRAARQPAHHLGATACATCATSSCRSPVRACATSRATALGVVAENPAQTVAAVLAAARLDGDADCRNATAGGARSPSGSPRSRDHRS